MNIQRFIAPTSREALAKARMTFGDGTLILSNRATPQGVEVVATAEGTLAEIDQQFAPAPAKASAQPAAATVTSAAGGKEFQSRVQDDADRLAMSTLSFQDYVRERMLRRRHEEAAAQAKAKPAAAVTSAVQVIAPDETPAAPTTPTASSTDIPKPVQVRKTTQTTSAPIPQGIVSELHAMKELIEERFNTLSWLGQARQNPIQSNLMLKLIRAGYSPNLARAILERMPADMDAAESVRWVVDVLERNLRTDADATSLVEEGGVFALIGATGVGKTTTAAKLAGLCAQKHGPNSVGLITLDTYRVGAHDQLRTYGKMLGIVAHLAHDKAALSDLLGLLSNKKMVLIDTTGLAPRDPRKRELMDLLELPAIKRLLVLNASGHGETLEEVVSAFKQSSAQQVIFSKIDEAVKLGPAIDTAIRHHLTVRGVTTGQRVPEDWEAANAAKLVQMSMRSSGSSVYDPKMSDLGFFFNEGPGHHPMKGHLDA